MLCSVVVLELVVLINDDTETVSLMFMTATMEVEVLDSNRVVI